jgi:hypothetical protein
MTRTLRSRRRPVRALEQVHRTPGRSLTAGIARAATSGPAKAAYIVIGGIGLAALAVAIIGPARIQSQVIRPLRGRVEEGAEQLWDESGPLRGQIAKLFDTAGSGRDRLVRSFQSWIGHFHAT